MIAKVVVNLTTKLLCPTIEFNCTQRHLYSNNESVPFPVYQTALSIP
jgi:hypothetical protein